MADHYNAFIVILEGDIRDENAEPLINAIKQLRGVLEVQPHVGDMSDAIATARVKSEMLIKWREALEGKL